MVKAFSLPGVEPGATLSGCVRPEPPKP